MDITIKPIITEKATKLTEKLNLYTFRVTPEANKYQIKDLVEKYKLPRTTISSILSSSQKI